MKIFAILAALILAIAGCTSQPVADTRAMTGHFSYIDTSQPGCGVLAIASQATFVVDDSGQIVKIAVPCLTLQSVKNAYEDKTPIKLGHRYKIVVSHEKPTPDMNSPYLFNGNPWYLVSIEQ